MNIPPAETKAALRALGLRAGASHQEVKLAFRSLARKYHPDKNGHNPRSAERFAKLSQAYKTVLDAYKPQPEGGFGAILGALFRPSADKCFHPSPVPGKKIETEASLSFDESVRGGTAELKITALAACALCGGHGSERADNFFSCPKCQGTGSILEGDGGFLGRAVCPKCLGHGRALKKCAVCDGRGREEREKAVKITIPPGVDDGDVITLPGEGHAGAMGGANGPLCVRVRAGRSAVFIKKGMDIHHEATLPFTMAVFGGKIIVPTIDGLVLVTVPPGLKVNTLLRLKGRGVSRLGNQLIRLIWEVPSQLTAREEGLLRAFAAAHGHPTEEDNWKTSIKRLGKAIRLG
jgi:molecular chaperone DnaJ